jgi:hypothetical protein
MILVHLAKSWPLIEVGERDAATETLGEWAGISDTALETYADGVLGIYKNTVVTAYDVTGWSRNPADGRITFEGKPSERWSHLIGTPNPGPSWVQGSARPVKYLDTEVLTGGAAPVEDVPEGRRAVVRGFILTVDQHNHATLVVPQGEEVTIIAGA